MVHEVSLPDGLLISDDRSRLDLAFIHEALADAYWTVGRPRAHTERSIAHCLCFGIYLPDGRQIGFARVMTDYTFRAHIADVIIRPDKRGRGLGKALIQAVLGHPELATVTKWTLVTADAHGLYRQFGFRDGMADPTWMAMTRSP